MPQAPTEATATEQPQNPARKTKYIPWAELLRRTFAIDISSAWPRNRERCMIASTLINSEDIAKRILTAMHLSAEVPQLHPARSPPRQAEGGGDDWPN